MLDIHKHKANETYVLDCEYISLQHAAVCVYGAIEAAVYGAPSEGIFSGIGLDETIKGKVKHEIVPKVLMQLVDFRRNEVTSRMIVPKLPMQDMIDALSLYIPDLKVIYGQRVVSGLKLVTVND